MTQQFFRNGQWVSAETLRREKKQEVLLPCIERKVVGKIADIIIPHHNRHDHLQRCLEGIDNSNFYIHVESGGSFSENCNNGAKNAKTDTLIFLNDDVETVNDILVELALTKHDYCGISQLLNNVKFTGIGWNKSPQVEARFTASTGKEDFLIPSGYCMKFKKSAWEKLGGLNEQFKNGGEDQDIGFRALEAGMSVGFIDLPMVHKHSQSAGRHDHKFENINLLQELWPNEKLEKMLAKRRKKIIENTPVLLTTYNRLDYTKKSLKSLLASDAKQILVFDNNSSDGTKEYLKKIKDKRVKIVFNKENEGVRGAMQYFFDNYPEAEWLAKIDNDTVVPKDWLQKLLACAIDNDLDIVQAKHDIIKAVHPDGWEGFTASMLEIKPGIHRHKFVGGAGIVIRRKAVGDKLPYTGWVLGGWHEWQVEHPEVKKAFCSEVEITLMDTNKDGEDYSKYPKYYQETLRA